MSESSDFEELAFVIVAAAEVMNGNVESNRTEIFEAQAAMKLALSDLNKLRQQGLDATKSPYFEPINRYVNLGSEIEDTSFVASMLLPLTTEKLHLALDAMGLNEGASSVVIEEPLGSICLTAYDTASAGRGHPMDRNHFKALQKITL